MKKGQTHKQGCVIHFGVIVRAPYYFYSIFSLWGLDPKAEKTGQARASSMLQISATTFPEQGKFHCP